MAKAKDLCRLDLARFLWVIYEREKLEQDWLKYLRDLELTLYFRLGMRKLRWYQYPVMSDFGLPETTPKNLPMHDMVKSAGIDLALTKEQNDNALLQRREARNDLLLEHSLRSYKSKRQKSR
jgi:hypothetical protein